MRILTIPNQSAVVKVFLELDEAGRMKPSAYYDRIVDVMKAGEVHAAGLYVPTWLTDRHNERKENA